jgi:hypothetical protein
MGKIQTPNLLHPDPTLTSGSRSISADHKSTMGDSKISVKLLPSGRLILSTVLFLLVAAGISIHCYRYSILEIDALGYAGTIALADTNNVVKIHDMVYSNPLTPHLRGLDGDSPQALDMRHRASDPYFAAVHFPYFAIKPLYVLTLEAIHKLGFGVIDSCRVGSALFYFAIAAMLWAWTRSWLALVVLILPETLILGQTQDPDGMSCFLLLLGLWLVFPRRIDLGLLPLLLAIWVRPENSLLCILVVLVLVIQGRMDWRKAAVLVVLSLGSEVVINHYGYSWNELYSHFLGGVPGAGAASSPFSKYGVSLVGEATAMFHSAVPLFGLLWLVCFPIVGEDMRWIMGTTVVFSAVRFVLFPMYEPRYYGLFFSTTSIAAVLSIRNRHYQDLPRELIRSVSRSISQFRKAA